MLSLLRGEQQALASHTVPFEEVFAKADKVLKRLRR